MSKEDQRYEYPLEECLSKFPWVENPTHKEIWYKIIEDRNKEYLQLNEYLKSKKRPEFIKSVKNPELQFLEENVFPVLLPLLEKTLVTAKKMDCLKHQKSLFNGIDYLSEQLWNTNPRHMERAENPLNIFFIPWVQEWLQQHPRPIFPKSWIWSKETAAIKIQSYIRAHFVRIDEDVQEMRQFWKTLEKERLEREAKEREEKEFEIKELKAKELEAKKREAEELVAKELKAEEQKAKKDQTQETLETDCNVDCPLIKCKTRECEMTETEPKA